MKEMSFIQSYKKFLDEQRNNLITNQFNIFIENNNIDSSAKLKKSFLKLVNLLDNDLDLKNLIDTTFIFDLLESLDSPKERELKKITNNFCEFLLTVGSGNTETHRIVRKMYAENIKDIIDNLSFEDSVKRSEDFKTEWVAKFKEQLNTM